MQTNSRMTVSIIASLSCLASYLSENKGLFVVGWIQSIVHHHACAELFPNCIRRQAVHINFNVCANFFVRQKLS